jgi:hypothetical protein
MKGSIIVLEKESVVVRTSFAEPHVVNWVGKNDSIENLLREGFTVRADFVPPLLEKLHNLRDKICYGGKITNREILDVINFVESEFK